MRTDNVRARLDRYSVPEPNSGCWLWLAALDGRGYGKLCVRGRYRIAARLAYELAVGPIPSGLDLRHRCGVKACVNPEHLDPAPRRETLKGGRQANREKTHCAKGHPYSPENTRHRLRNGYRCRRCMWCSLESTWRRRGQL